MSEAERVLADALGVLIGLLGVVVLVFFAGLTVEMWREIVKDLAGRARTDRRASRPALWPQG